jgi:hypothetical protein
MDEPFVREQSRLRKPHDRAMAEAQTKWDTLLHLAENGPILGVNVVCVGHKTRRQCGDPRAVLPPEKGAISLDILTRVGAISEPTYVPADVPEPRRKVPIQVAESESTGDRLKPHPPCSCPLHPGRRVGSSHHCTGNSSRVAKCLPTTLQVRFL